MGPEGEIRQLEPPFMGIQEAAAACGVSADTIRRRIRTGEMPGAVVGDGGRWQIPPQALVDAGLLDASRLWLVMSSTEPTAAEFAGSVGLAAVVAAYEAHLGDLRAEILRLHALLMKVVSEE